MKKRKILVTSALPYANGPIHLGHLVEYIQTDIWVRFQKLQGNEVYYFCADDTHGTPIMITAQKLNLTPEELIEKIYKEHLRDLTLFEVEFDNYYTTNSTENRALSERIYLKAKEKGHIYKKKVKQLFCPHDKMFLPDRYVKGKCPKCGAEDQYGDSCEKCGASYRPTDLIEPRCALCGTIPIEKEEDHIFFKLSDFTEFLKEWTQTRLDEGIKNKLMEWFEQGLKDWDISRDGPYFGFEIPDEPNKYFYVWLDAPVGYIASSLNYFQKHKKEKTFFEFWNVENEQKTEVYHFIGKDIVYFHTLFWPALLKAGDFRTPTSVFVHGFLTINGEKMSKSRGTFVKAQSYLKFLDPQALRYFYASRLGSSIDDLDFTIEDFVNKYNGSVVGNFANIFSRSAKLLETLDNTLSTPTEKGKQLIQTLLQKKSEILDNYEKRNLQKVVRILEDLGSEINRYITEKEPWVVIKQNPEEARKILTDVLNAGWILSIYLYPILPSFSKGVWEFLNIPVEYKNQFSILSNKVEKQTLLPSNHKIHPYRHLATRIQKEDVEKMFQEEQKEIPQAEEKETKTQWITIEDFNKIEIKIGKIVEAKFVEGADKLLQLKIDVGEKTPRNVFAGIKEHYQPNEIVGMKVAVVTNLQPRKMKFGVSEAMILAANDQGKLSLLLPHKDVETGSIVK
ncbi:MAG: methionine--tRNA ligase [Leptospiraceae bacterium]|nr:methionine--tRNA ligase [Leptospiraceae bacterium]MDW7975307.1 methionine--tRNA ligase [Leptospiraceae bacterium]